MTGIPAHIGRVSAMRHCVHSARVCQFPCSQNCETRNFFAQNITENIDWLESHSTRVNWIESQSTQVPDVCSSNWWRNYLARVLFNSSPRRLSVNRHWNYSARVLVNSSPQHPSVYRHWNYLPRVLVVCPSTIIRTVDSHPSRLYLDRHNL